MAGDNITDEFKGNVYSDRMNTEYATQRFRSTSLKLRTLTIRNNGSTYDAFIGLYNSSENTFFYDAFTLKPNYQLWLEYVDLYNLGYYYSGGITPLEIIGTY